MTSWNTYSTADQKAIVAGVQTIAGGGGDPIHAYVARPEGSGPFPGVVLAHHLPGWDEVYQEFARRFANHGYVAICPDLYCRDGHGTPTEIADKVRGEGQAPDARVVSDLTAARDWLLAQPNSNGKVGVMGTCSGGRHAVLAASAAPYDAAVDLWGGRVVMSPDQISDRLPVAPIDLTADLKAPLLGIFGNDDQAPTAEQVDQHEAELKKHGKTYEFHRYDGAGHGIWYYHTPLYRPQAAMDSWQKVFDWFEKYLS
jgi:carboxymethylenebutenolidase